MSKKQIHSIDSAKIKNKKILLRVDFNVALHPNHTIADDERIRRSLPTIKMLLEDGNKLVLISHLGRPKSRDQQFSLKPVAKHLQKYFAHHTIKLIENFITEDASTFENQTEKEILLLENIRFYPEEKANNEEFAMQLSKLAEVYVNDAFAVSHRDAASIVGITKRLPSYAGLLLQKEIEMISKVTQNPRKPVVAILGGAKVSTKIHLIETLMTVADQLIIGGAMANTFLAAQGYNVGNSLVEQEFIDRAKQLLKKTTEKCNQIILPIDVVTAKDMKETTSEVHTIQNIPKNQMILDIGPETEAHYGKLIDDAKTIIWNGPVGYFENPTFRRGTDFIYYAITENTDAISLVGGGDTLAAIAKEEYLEKLTHISTGGGAMLEFIEHGTLPGIEALKQ